MSWSTLSVMLWFALIHACSGAIHTTQNNIGVGDVDVTDKKPVILVLGATGRTGAILYEKLRAVAEVRALVRSVEKARTTLACNTCGTEEGIYIGDATNASSLLAPTKGVDAVAFTVGPPWQASEEVVKATVEDGIHNTVAALTQPANLVRGLASLRLVMISSMGTRSKEGVCRTNSKFWKLHAEAFVANSGLPFMNIRPCGLDMYNLTTMVPYQPWAPRQSHLLAGHHD